MPSIDACGSSDGAARYITFQVRRENHPMVGSAGGHSIIRGTLKKFPSRAGAFASISSGAGRDACECARTRGEFLQGPTDYRVTARGTNHRVILATNLK